MQTNRDMRFFDSDPAIRRIAEEIYGGTKAIPILSPHGHTDPAWFAENKPFSDPANLLIVPDHYVFRLLYSQGVPLEELGIPRLDGGETESDPRKIWETFAKYFYLFTATPTGAWFEHIFQNVFGIDEVLNERTSHDYYEIIDSALKTDSFLPRNIMDRFNIEVLATTDAAFDSLKSHKQIKDSNWQGRVIPTFRPDAVTDLSHPTWQENIITLGKSVRYEITSYDQFIRALEERRQYFKSMGATATDQGVVTPYTHKLDQAQCDSIFRRALRGHSSDEDAALFTAHMLIEMARMSVEDGLVMQVHPGSFRNHNTWIFEKFGADKGADIPLQVEYTRNLLELLNLFGNDIRLNLIIFTLDETNYARELAPLAGHYPALKLGPAWWFNDSIEGMKRFREATTETASFYNTVGFNDDTRALLSIPARHDQSRRVDANYLAGLVARHQIDLDTARDLGRALAYDLAKAAYKL